jgi:hypothetical protein
MLLAVAMTFSATTSLERTKAQLREGTIKLNRNMKPATLAALRCDV